MAVTSWTWNRILEAALTESGLVGKNQPIKPLDLKIAKDQLEYLLDEWDGKGLALPTLDTQIAFNTVANQAEYVLGPDSNPPYSDPAPASFIRPEEIVTGTVNISTGVPVQIPIVPMDFAEYQRITVKSTSGQPYNFAVNLEWPQVKMYLFPTPSQAYPVSFTCKLKWANTETGTTEVGTPSENIYNVAQIQSGAAIALKDNLKLKIAKAYRLDTPQMENDASQGLFMMAAKTSRQLQQQNANRQPYGIFPWNIGTAGTNPPW